MVGLSERLKRCRKAAGLTQAQAAHGLGIDTPSIGRWERGEKTPRVETLAKLAVLYGCSLDDFIDWSGVTVWHPET